MRKTALILIVLVYGCTLAQIQVDVQSERTTLENQVLGTYNALDTDMMLAASVRAVDSQGTISPPPEQSQDKKDAITAMQILEFHADDLSLFKKWGWVGENNQGLLQSFDPENIPVPETQVDLSRQYTIAEFNDVVSDINTSRNLIMQRVVDLNENLTQADLPEIGRLFGRLNRENAVAGERIQTEDGQWTTKAGQGD